MSKFDNLGAEKMVKKKSAGGGENNNKKDDDGKKRSSSSKKSKKSSGPLPTTSEENQPQQQKSGVKWAAGLPEIMPDNGDDDFGGGNDFGDDRFNASQISDNTDSSLGGGGSSITGDSASRQSGSTGSGTTARGIKSTLPCGMTMPVMMSILILIPIIFLVVYTGIPVSEAVASENLLSEHKSVIEDILWIGSRLQEERRDATIFLISAPGSADALAASASMDEFRALASSRMHKMMNTMQDSNLDFRAQFMNDAKRQFEILSAQRQRIDTRLVTGPEMRAYLLTVVEDFYSLLLWIAKDPRAETLESRFVFFLLLRRMTNTIGTIRSIGSALIGRDGFDAQNREELYAMRSVFNRDFDLAVRGGKPEVVGGLTEWQNSNEYIKFWEAVEVLQNGNNVTWSNMSATEWLDDANACVDRLTAVDNGVLEVLTNGKILNEIAVTEGMKMFGAIFACLIATVFVIYYNNREQARLEKALESTAILTTAVRRFVPTHQLKTMGARSITHVHGGMTTEVAQSILFSDVRNFSGVASSMSSLDLFDWLQNYVEKMTAVVSEEKSYISNFLGDGLMIIAPQPTYGVKACIKMQVAVDKINLELVANGGTRPITIGCGLHHGVVVAGVFGDETRLTCSFIATDVNLASRLEQLTKSFGSKILVSETVVNEISPEVFSFRNVGKVMLSGAVKPMQIYDVFNADPLNVKEYKADTKKLFEEAVRLSEFDTEAALEIFERLQLVARSRSVYDKAVESRKTGAHLDRSNASSNSRSQEGSLVNKSANFTPGIMEFEKDGEIKGSSVNNSQYDAAGEMRSAHGNDTEAEARRVQLDSFFGDLKNGPAFPYKNQHSESQQQHQGGGGGRLYHETSMSSQQDSHANSGAAAMPPHFTATGEADGMMVK